MNRIHAFQAGYFFLHSFDFFVKKSQQKIERSVNHLFCLSWVSKKNWRKKVCNILINNGILGNWYVPYTTHNQSLLNWSTKLTDISTLSMLRYCENLEWVGVTSYTPFRNQHVHHNRDHALPFRQVKYNRGNIILGK